MNKYLKLSFLLLLLIGLGHLISRKEGYYGSIWYTDIILHITAGVAIGLIWIGLVGKPKTISDYILIALFAVFGSYLWEIWEFTGLHVIPDKLIYIPELGDSLGDIAAGFVGGTLLSVYLYFKNPNKTLSAKS
ncbi:MAG: hypothetical protein M3Q24_00650 [bacterium]|nr:hypothetical protein [bacterium]